MAWTLLRVYKVSNKDQLETGGHRDGRLVRKRGEGKKLKFVTLGHHHLHSGTEDASSPSICKVKYTSPYLPISSAQCFVTRRACCGFGRLRPHPYDQISYGAAGTLHKSFVQILGVCGQPWPGSLYKGKLKAATAMRQCSKVIAQGSFTWLSTDGGFWMQVACVQG